MGRTRQHPCVLIIHEDANLMHALKQQLQEEYHIYLTNNAAEGFHILRSETVQVVITDPHTKGRNSLAFFSALETEFPDIIRVILVDRADRDEIVSMLNEGRAFRYIPRSWTPKALRTIVRQAFQQHDLLHCQQRLLTVQESNRALKQEIAQSQAMEAMLRDAERRREKHLQEAKTAADLASRAKSEFLADMSHELRTPLNGILGYTQILKRDSALNAQQIRAVEIIHRSSEHLLMMINDILDLSKIEARKISMNPAVFNLPGMLRDLVEMFRIRAEKQGIQFHYEPLSALPYDVLGDEKCLRQVLLNILGNAMKFTVHGRVALKVEAKPQREPSLSPSPPRLICFQVEDTGIGIPAEQLDSIFLPFQQANHQTLHAEGSGLGLSISQRLVDLMGGRLQVTSIEGRGSTFWFELTLPEAKAPTPAKNDDFSKIAGYQGKRLTILVVDDKELNRELLKNVLSPLDFRIIEAASGHEALAKVKDIHPDAIVLDLVMPGMDGFETARQIRRLEGQKAQMAVDGSQSVISLVTDYSQPIIIALSASAFHQTKEMSLSAGCDTFLAKPFQNKELLEALQRHLELEWIMEAPLHNDAIPTPPQQLTIVPPSSEELLTLRKLAVMGDIAGLKQRVDAQKTSAPSLAPFFENIARLIEEFQIIQIQTFIESYLPISPEENRDEARRHSTGQNLTR